MRVRPQGHHGNFICVNQIGVFICGAPRIGKTSLSLELLARGHKLIADDFTYFIESNQGVIGFAPRRLYGKLFTRGSLFDLKKSEDSTSVIRYSKLGLICHLVVSKCTLQSNFMAHRIVTHTMFGQSFPEYLSPATAVEKQARYLEKIILKLKKK